MEYFAKSPNLQGHQETVKEHLQNVSALARTYGEPLGLGNAAALEGAVHDLGKYTKSFQDVLKGLRTGVDHAMGGACYLEMCYRGRANIRPIVEAVNGHHDGLVAYDLIRSELHALADDSKSVHGNNGKDPSIETKEQLTAAFAEFQKDFPNFRLPAPLPLPPSDILESMLYTRMLFSCLVDADYTASAINDDSAYLGHAEDNRFDPQALLEKLYARRNEIKQSSTANQTLNSYRDLVFDQCGAMGAQPEGLFTLTAPTGTGKTLALLHFALRHCLVHGKRRVIIVLPFLTLAEQSADAYGHIIPNILIDHSQSDLPESGRELAARWSAPVIITTSVRFFESLFSDQPTACRKLHNIADSVVIFDEAQSLPADLTSATLRAVNELCSRYHTTMVFSTATQPDFAAREDLRWTPREILPDHRKLFDALQRVEVDWRVHTETPLEAIAEEMSRFDSVCAIVNLRRHARVLVAALEQLCPENTVFFLTTDLCPAHRSRQIERIRQRLAKGLSCRVVATQCIEAGVDLDFGRMYRALAPLEAIIQAAGRCNRNGRGSLGQVVVFRPEDSRMPYPDPWYNNAAVVVQEMKPPFSIHDPEKIREYYRLLLSDASDKAELTRAIDARAFDETAAQYKLIANTGAQVIVPYPGEQERYDRIAGQLRERGITGLLLKEAAPITVTSFAKNLGIYAEEIPFARQKRSHHEEAAGSNIYLLRPQYERLYSDKLGLQFPQEAQANLIF